MFSWSLCLSIELLQEIGEPLQPDAVRSFDQDQGLRYGMFPELCGQYLLRRVESRVGGPGFQTAVSLREMRSDQQDTGIGNFGGEGDDMAVFRIRPVAQFQHIAEDQYLPGAAFERFLPEIDERCLHARGVGVVTVENQGILPGAYFLRAVVVGPIGAYGIADVVPLPMIMIILMVVIL